MPTIMIFHPEYVWSKRINTLKKSPFWAILGHFWPFQGNFGLFLSPNSNVSQTSHVTTQNDHKRGRISMEMVSEVTLKTWGHLGSFWGHFGGNLSKSVLCWGPKKFGDKIFFYFFITDWFDTPYAPIAPAISIGSPNNIIPHINEPPPLKNLSSFG